MLIVIIFLSNVRSFHFPVDYKKGSHSQLMIVSIKLSKLLSIYQIISCILVFQLNSSNYFAYFHAYGVFQRVNAAFSIANLSNCTTAQYYSILNNGTCQTCNGYTKDGKCYCYDNIPEFEMPNVPSTCSRANFLRNIFDINGNYSAQQQSCINKAFYNGQTCQLCPNNTFGANSTCDCQSGLKLSDYYCVSSNITITNSAASLSSTIGPKALLGCQQSDILSCHQLANICVQDFAKTISSSLACTYLNTSNFSTILFPKIQGANLIQNSNVAIEIVAKDPSTSNEFNKFPYYYIIFHTDGTSSEYKLLRNELMLCSYSYYDAEKSYRFGVKIQQTCQLDMKKIPSTTQFFQIFLYNGTNGTYIPIPVRIQNFNLQPQNAQDDNFESFSNYIYRFYLFDGNISTTLQYAKSLIFYVNLASNSKIYLPYISIQYSNYSIGADQTIYYRELYYSTTNFYVIATVLLVLVCIGVVIVWMVRLWVWSKANPPYMAEQLYTILLCSKGLFSLLDIWSEAMFYYLFLMTGYWFIFFKFQNYALVQMPPLSNYTTYYQSFEILFYMMFAARLITTFQLVLSQADLEIFFIDWEKLEIQRPKSIQDEIDIDVRRQLEKYEPKVSAWRTLLIANEFNELSTYRIVSIEWSLFFVAFFLEGVHWINLQSEQPNLDIDFVVQKNYILTFFLYNFLFFTVGLAQIIIQKIFDIWFPIAIEDFVDLCSIANISIMIIDDLLHGYYLHGENPIGQAEGSNEHLTFCLQYESEGKGKKRGYLQIEKGQNKDDAELQTFEIFLPQKFRMSYDQVFKIPLRSQTDQAQGGYNDFSLLRDPVPNRLDMAEVELSRQRLSFYIKDILTQVRINPTKFVRDKFPLQRLLNLPPAELEDPQFKDQSIPIFYRDPDYSFKKIFFCGHEFFFLISDVMMFSFWMLLTNNVYVAVLLTYLYTNGLFSYRQWVGERNLADKSKINQKFLI
ncbi:hypothetical protein pb186bvf_003675 [Paramecium bursaria]